MVLGCIQYFMLNVKGFKVDGKREFFCVGRFRVGCLRYVCGRYRVVFCVSC